MESRKGLWFAVDGRQAEPLLARFLASTPRDVLFLDADGVVVGANHDVSLLTGLPCEAMVRERSLNLRAFLRAVNPGASAELEKAYAGDIGELSEYFFRARADGRFPLPARLREGCWLTCRMTPLRGDDGRVAWVVVEIEDVTARKRLDLILVQAQKMEAIGALAGGLAHDFNNILSSIVGYASLLVSRLAPGGTDVEAAQTILDAGDRAAGLTAKLLTIARRSVPALGSLQLGEEVPRTAVHLSRMIGPRYDIRLELAPDLHRVDADRPQIEQVVSNLVLNARDAMPEGGVIVLKAANRRIEDPGAGPLPNMPSGDYVELSVVDTGVGMVPEIVNRIFEPFFTTKQMGWGTGLGLAIVYGIVKSHRGFILVQSAPGEGSTFTVWLPKGRMRPSQPILPRTPRAGEARVPQGLSVLVVDDDPMVRRALCDMLSRLGHIAVESDGTDQAIDLLMRDRSRYDLLVVDVIMPERTGFDLVESLRKAEWDIPVLLCTGFSSPEVYARVRGLKAVEILPKPFNLQYFSEAVARLLAL